MISPDNTQFLTSAWDEPIKLWDIETGTLLDQFGSDLPEIGQTLHGADFHPTLPHLAVMTPPNRIRIHTLDLDELVTIAAEMLTRGFTNDECLRYLERECDDVA